MGGGVINHAGAMARCWAVADRRAADATARVSSGLRIVSAADDAAGLGIAERLRSESNESLRTQRTMTDVIGALHTADGALGEATGMLHRARELIVRHATGTLADEDMAALEAEIESLGAEIGRMGRTTAFNGFALLRGGSLGLHVGGADGRMLSTALPDLEPLVSETVAVVQQLGAERRAKTKGGGNGGGNGNGNGNGRAGRAAPAPTTTTTTTTTSSTTTLAGDTPLDRVDAAIDWVSGWRSTIGGFSNRLTYAMGALATQHENLVATESRIRDADVAAEIVSLARHRVTSEASRALSAQAHLRARDVLQLLAA